MVATLSADEAEHQSIVSVPKSLQSTNVKLEDVARTVSRQFVAETTPAEPNTAKVVEEIIESPDEEQQLDKEQRDDSYESFPGMHSNTFSTITNEARDDVEPGLINATSTSSNDSSSIIQKNDKEHASLWSSLCGYSIGSCFFAPASNSSDVQKGEIDFPFGSAGNLVEDENTNIASESNAMAKTSSGPSKISELKRLNQVTTQKDAGTEDVQSKKADYGFPPESQQPQPKTTASEAESVAVKQVVNITKSDENDVTSVKTASSFASQKSSLSFKRGKKTNDKWPTDGESQNGSLALESIEKKNRIAHDDAERSLGTVSRNSKQNLTSSTRMKEELTAGAGNVTAEIAGKEIENPSLASKLEELNKQHDCTDTVDKKGADDANKSVRTSAVQSRKSEYSASCPTSSSQKSEPLDLNEKRSVAGEGSVKMIPADVDIEITETETENPNMSEGEAPSAELQASESSSIASNSPKQCDKSEDEAVASTCSTGASIRGTVARLQSVTTKVGEMKKEGDNNKDLSSVEFQSEGIAIRKVKETKRRKSLKRLLRGRRKKQMTGGEADADADAGDDAMIVRSCMRSISVFRSKSKNKKKASKETKRESPPEEKEREETTKNSISDTEQENVLEMKKATEMLKEKMHNKEEESEAKPEVAETKPNIEKSEDPARRNEVADMMKEIEGIKEELQGEGKYSKVKLQLAQQYFKTETKPSIEKSEDQASIGNTKASENTEDEVASAKMVSDAHPILESLGRGETPPSRLLCAKGEFKDSQVLVSRK